MLQDILGRPIKIGDTILVKGYGSRYNDTITTVDKVTKENIYVLIRDPWVEGWYMRDPQTHSRPEPKRLACNPYEYVVINEQLAYNSTEWPELFI